MSSNKILNVQIINTHDTESNWKQIENNFVPFDGEIIVYSPDEGHANSRIKIGNGKATLAQLNFFTGNIIKTKTAPGANNNNTQTIYQVVDNNDEVVSYWYYSNGEWCELGANNVDLSGKADIDHTHTSLDVVNWDNEIISILPNKEGGLSFGVDTIDLSLRDASNTSDRIIWPQHDENDKPVWNLGLSWARFKAAYVDKIVSQVGDGWTTSITPIFVGTGPGYQVDHLTASTLFINGHCNDNTPILMFGQVPIFTWTSPWTESGEDNGMQFNGDVYAENLEVGNIINAQKFVTGWSEIGPDTITTNNILLSDAKQQGDNVLIYNYYDSNEDVSYVSMEHLYVDYEIRTDGDIYENGEALADRYARKDEISQPMLNTTYADLVSLRDNASLVPGQLYRITDYICTTTQENTSSTGHQFDIIVRADADNILNEEAWATYHREENVPVSPDEIVAPQWKEGIQPQDIVVNYKLTNDAQYNPPVEEEGIAVHIFTTTNADGIEVPAFVDPDPDGDSGWTNTLVSIQYVLTDDDEVLYEGPCPSHNDVFVELGYIDGTPVLYKTNPGQFMEVDYADVFKYAGKGDLDGEEFDVWEKYEDGEYSGFQVFTQRIVQNGVFTITQEQLTNAIEMKYVPSDGDIVYIYAGKYSLDGEVYDCWFEEEAEDSLYGRLTNEVVDGDLPKPDYFANCNLSAWELKYCLDNDCARFTWANEENGRGVIYYMKDEYNNECWYDFKNMLFSGLYTFGDYNDDSRFGSANNNIVKSSQRLPYNRLGKEAVGNVIEQESENNIFTFGCKYNHLGVKCCNNRFDLDCCYNRLGDECCRNEFCSSSYNTLDALCCDNAFTHNCDNNHLKQECATNTFWNASHNMLGSLCTNNSFDDSDYNALGDSCDGNNFESASYNRIDASCNSNSFSQSKKNTLGFGCSSNEFSTADTNTLITQCNSGSFVRSNRNTIIKGNDCDFTDSDSNSLNDVYAITLQKTEWFVCTASRDIRIASSDNATCSNCRYIKIRGATPFKCSVSIEGIQYGTWSDKTDDIDLSQITESVVYRPSTFKEILI